MTLNQLISYVKRYDWSRERTLYAFNHRLEPAARSYLSRMFNFEKTLILDYIYGIQILRKWKTKPVYNSAFLKYCKAEAKHIKRIERKKSPEW